MNIQSNPKTNSIYLLVLFALVSLLAFSSCEEKSKEEPTPDYKTLMIGDYVGTINAGSFVIDTVKATVKAGSKEDEVIFTEFISGSDSTTQIKIELRDLGSRQAIDLFIEEQRISGVQVVGKAIGESSTDNDHGYFLYQNLETKEIINQFAFNISANGGDYLYIFEKKKE